MPITPEQAEQAKDIILETLDIHYQGSLPYRDVWTVASEDFDGVAILKAWVIYEGERSILDISMLNSYASYLYQALLDARIRALPSVSYISQSDADERGKEWFTRGWQVETWTG